MRCDASTAECLVYTFREGLLAAVGHDLCLRVARFTVELGDGDAIVAELDAASLACHRHGRCRRRAQDRAARRRRRLAGAPLSHHHLPLDARGARRRSRARRGRADAARPDPGARLRRRRRRHRLARRGAPRSARLRHQAVLARCSVPCACAPTSWLPCACRAPESTASSSRNRHGHSTFSPQLFTDYAMANSPENKGFGQGSPALARWAERVFHPEDDVLREIRARSVAAGLPPIAVGQHGRPAPRGGGADAGGAPRRRDRHARGLLGRLPRPRHARRTARHLRARAAQRRGRPHLLRKGRRRRSRTHPRRPGRATDCARSRATARSTSSSSTPTRSAIRRT